MSDTEPTTEPDGEGALPQVRAALKREQERNAALAEEAEAGRTAVRRLAFVEAKIPLDNPVAAMFAENYKGEMDSTAIQTAWEALGYSPPGSDTPEPSGGQQEPEESPEGGPQEHRRRLGAEGAPPGTEPDKDPVEAALIAGRNAGPRGSVEAMGAYFQEVLNATGDEDPRVMHVGTIDDQTRRQWHDDAKRRQIGNRDAARARQ